MRQLGPLLHLPKQLTPTTGIIGGVKNENVALIEVECVLIERGKENEGDRETLNVSAKNSSHEKNGN